MYRLDALRLVNGTPFETYTPSSPDEMIEVWGAGFSADLGGFADDRWLDANATADGWDGVFSIDLWGEEWSRPGAYAAAIYDGFVSDSPFEVVAREHGIVWDVSVKEAPHGTGRTNKVLLSGPLPKNSRAYVGWWVNTLNSE